MERAFVDLDVKKAFGAAVREQRQRLGLSQEALAELAGLHRTYISGVELGERNLSLESIYRLARALGISVQSFFGPVAEATSPGADAPPAEILLVEDNAQDIELTVTAFRHAQLTNRLQVVRDGAAALELLLGPNPPPRRPQVMLLDLHLPKVHGLEVLRRIKADERTRGIRVVILTVSRRDEHIQEALRLGAEAYLVKPVDFQSFAQITPELRFRWTLVGPELRQVA